MTACAAQGYESDESVLFLFELAHKDHTSEISALSKLVLFKTKKTSAVVLR